MTAYAVHVIVMRLVISRLTVTKPMVNVNASRNSTKNSIRSPKKSNAYHAIAIWKVAPVYNVNRTQVSVHVYQELVSQVVDVISVCRLTLK